MNFSPIPNILIALLLAGCAAAPATRLYTLAPAAPTPSIIPVPGAGGMVRVREVSLPRYLDRPQIVTRPNPYRLQLHELAQWGGDLGEDLTRVLAANLAQRLPGRTVLPAPTFSTQTAARTVMVEILQFEAVGDQLVLAVRWQLDDARPAELRLSQLLAARTVDAVLVAAMSRLYGELADVIAAGLHAEAK